MEDPPQEILCSNCKRDINAATFELHDAHCRRHIQLCDICDEPVPRTSMEEHFEENHALIPCDICGKEIAKDKLDDHKDQLCPERMVECKYCELDIKFKDFETHLDSCGSRTDYCDRCNRRVMLKNMEEHKAMKCGRGESPPIDETLGNIFPYAEEYPVEEGRFDDFHYNDFAGGHVHVYEHYQNGLTAEDVPHDQPHPTENTQNAPESFQVDPQWLETVAKACSPEDLDRVLAQNMFYENLRQVSARDEYHGVRHEVLQEGEEANRRKDVEQHQLQDDEQLARQLQRELDNKTIEEQRDERLARQMQQRLNHNHHQTEPTPPPAYEPPSPSVYEDAELARKLQEEENMKFSGEGVSGPSTSYRHGRNDHVHHTEPPPPPHYNPPSPSLNEDAELARKLQEQERFGRSYSGGGPPTSYRHGRNGHVNLTEPPPPPRYNPPSPSLNEDAELARKLQEQERFGRSYSGGGPPTSYRHGRNGHVNLTGPPPPPRYNPPSPSLNEDAELARKLQEQERFGRSYSGGDVNGPSTSYSYGHSDRTHASSGGYTPNNDTYAHQSTGYELNDRELDRHHGEVGGDEDSHGLYSGGLRSVPYMDEDQPRPKTPPTVRKRLGRAQYSVEEPEDGEGVPCQFCNELIPFDDIMEHQKHCTADYDYKTAKPSTSSYSGYYTPSGVLRTHGDYSKSIDVDALLKDSESEDELEYSTACQFCGDTFPKSCIMPHQALCDKNPDKHLKDVYPSWRGKDAVPATARKVPTHSPLQRQPLHSTKDDPEVPCEFCGSSYRYSRIQVHQSICKGNPEFKKRVQQRSKSQGGAVASQPATTEEGPCEFCEEQFPITELVGHEATCRYSLSNKPKSTTGGGMATSELALDIQTRQSDLASFTPKPSPAYSPSTSQPVPFTDARPSPVYRPPTTQPVPFTDARPSPVYSPSTSQPVPFTDARPSPVYSPSTSQPVPFTDARPSPVYSPSTSQPVPFTDTRPKESNPRKPKLAVRFPSSSHPVSTNPNLPTFASPPPSTASTPPLHLLPTPMPSMMEPHSYTQDHTTSPTGVFQSTSAPRTLEGTSRKRQSSSSDFSPESKAQRLESPLGSYLPQPSAFSPAQRPSSSPVEGTSPPLATSTAILQGTSAGAPDRPTSLSYPFLLHQPMLLYSMPNASHSNLEGTARQPLSGLKPQSDPDLQVVPSSPSPTKPAESPITATYHGSPLSSIGSMSTDGVKSSSFPSLHSNITSKIDQYSKDLTKDSKGNKEGILGVRITPNPSRDRERRFGGLTTPPGITSQVLTSSLPSHSSSVRERLAGSSMGTGSALRMDRKSMGLEASLSVGTTRHHLGTGSAVRMGRKSSSQDGGLEASLSAMRITTGPSKTSSSAQPMSKQTRSSTYGTTQSLKQSNIPLLSSQKYTSSSRDSPTFETKGARFASRESLLPKVKQPPSAAGRANVRTVPPRSSSVKTGLASVPPRSSSVKTGLAPVSPRSSSVKTGLAPVSPRSSSVKTGLESVPPRSSSVKTGLESIPPRSSSVKTGLESVSQKTQAVGRGTTSQNRQSASQAMLNRPDMTRKPSSSDRNKRTQTKPAPKNRLTNSHN